MTIRVLETHEVARLEELFELYCQVFQEQHVRPEAKVLADRLQDPAVFFVAALVEDELVGGMTIYVQPSLYTDQVYYNIFDMAIKQAWQNRGIGRKMLHFMIELARQDHAEALYIEADDGDDAANHLYHSLAVRSVHATVYDLI